jgi:hypothetical protein
MFKKEFFLCAPASLREKRMMRSGKFQLAGPRFHKILAIFFIFWYLPIVKNPLTGQKKENPLKRPHAYEKCK